MKNSIKTTRELREFITSAMVDVRTGRLDTDKANAINKLAGQVNTSVYGELKAKVVLANMGEETYEHGDLEI